MSFITSDIPSTMDSEQASLTGSWEPTENNQGVTMPFHFSNTDLEQLVKGALAVAVDRCEILGGLDKAINYTKKRKELKKSGQSIIDFWEEEEEPKQGNDDDLAPVPWPPQSQHLDLLLQMLEDEREYCAMYQTMHPLCLWSHLCNQMDAIPADDMAMAEDGAEINLAGKVIAIKRGKTKVSGPNGDVYAFVTLEGFADHASVALWPDVFFHHKKSLKVGMWVIVSGHVKPGSLSFGRTLVGREVVYLTTEMAAKNFRVLEDAIAASQFKVGVEP